MEKLTQKQKSEKLLELQSLRVDKELFEFEQKKLNKLLSQLEKTKEKIKEQKEIISLFKSEIKLLTSCFIDFLVAKGFDNYIDNIANARMKGICVSIHNRTFETVKRVENTYDYIFKDLKIKYKYDVEFDKRNDLIKEFEDWLKENKIAQI